MFSPFRLAFLRHFPRWAVARCLLLALLGSSLASDSATAIEPSLSYLFPPGGRRGTTVDLRVSGLYLHEGCAFETLGPGIEASDRLGAVESIRFDQQAPPRTYFSQEKQFPRDFAATVRIAPETPLGIRFVRASTGQGASSMLRFVIGDLPELVEKEVAGNAIPESVELPITVNGRIYPREDVDIWRVEARAGQPITCAVNAARLGSTLDSRLEVRDTQGRRIAENTDHYGSDSFLRFTAPEDGAYFVHIHDIRFGGLPSSVYRLTLTDGPYVDLAYPLGARRGAKAGFELIGQATPDAPVEVAIPADGADQYVHHFDLDGQLTNGVLLDVSDWPEKLEAEPNDEPDAAALVTTPVVLNGRIGAVGDVDGWTFDAKKDETLAFEFRALRPELPIDPIIVVSDSTGKEMF